MLNGKTDNELWLNRINLIPENEYKLIGAGGYGRVYKIKMKAELTELAVKIVQGVCKVDDYKYQVFALEKEYAMVTSLDYTIRELFNFLVLFEMSPKFE